MSESTLPDLEEYRSEARAWLADNAEKVQNGNRPRYRLGGTSIALDAECQRIAGERQKQKKLFDAGYAGITWKKEWGGQGLPAEYQRVFNEEAAGYSMPHFGAAHSPTMGVCAGVMQVHASAEFLAHHMPKILSGEELWCQFFSEPSAGSDLAGITTRAERDGDRWILNGSKVWTTGAFLADYGLCLARTNWDVPKHQGLTWFAVKIDQPGVEVVPIRKIDNAAEFCQEFFTDAEVTGDDIVGELNEGWTVAQTMLVLERGGNLDPNAPPSIYGGMSGISAMTLAPDLVALAKRVGRDKDPYVRQQLARASINDFASGQMFVRIGGLLRAGAQPAGVAGYGKLVQGIFQSQRGRIAMEIGRGAAVTWDADDVAGQSTSLSYLNARQLAIAGGTNEVQRNGIGERVLGLPREPSFDTTKPFREVLSNAKNWSHKRA